MSVPASASWIREWLDMQSAKFEAQREAYGRFVEEAAMQIAIISAGRSAYTPFSDTPGYRKGRRRYGYRRFPSRRARWKWLGGRAP